MHGLTTGALRVSRAAIAFAYLLSLMTSVAQAQHVLNELGTAPLLGFGTMHSAAELRERVDQHRAMFETASGDLGLTSAETGQLEAAIDAENVQWVRIPRHLDEMTWAWDGSVYMYRDVVIPADSYGWEIDIPVGSTVHALFIPAACGNLSRVERSRQISYRPPAPHYVQPQCPPGTNGSPPNCYAPAQCPPGTSGTPPNCYAPSQQCPPGTTGVPPNCYAPQPPPEAAAPPAQLTPVVVKTVVKNNMDWWVIPLAFVGFFVGVHYHNNYYFYPPPAPKCQCTPPPPPPSCPPSDP